MKVKKSIQTATESLGLNSLRKFQIEPINNILDHRDTFVIAPTSAGKSAIYQIPALIKSGKDKWTLVIEPTLALIADQVSKLQSLGITAEMMTSRNSLLKEQMLYLLRKTSDSAGLSTAVRKLKDHYKNVDDRRIRKIFSAFDKLGIAPITRQND